MSCPVLFDFKDIASFNPHTKHLVTSISKDVNCIQDNLRNLQNALSEVSSSQKKLASAYGQLSTSVKASLIEEFASGTLSSQLKQLVLQFSSFLDELIELHNSASENIEIVLSTKLDNLINGIFSRLPEELSQLEIREKSHEQAYQAYMKLPKKCTPKLHQTALIEITSARRQFAQSAALYYGHLNEAEQIRELAPLLVISAFTNEQQQSIRAAHDLFNQAIVTSFVEVAETLLQKRLKAFHDLEQDCLAHINSVEHGSLSIFCPEPWILSSDFEADPQTIVPSCEPNLKLLSKSGRLFMRTRINLVPRWIQIYCITQNGNLMFQHNDDIAASLLIDLNQKGVYTEQTESDDRRNVFQVISPTERKTVILQAESVVERDEWIATLTNIIFSTNNSIIQPSSESRAQKSSDQIVQQQSNGSDQYSDWLSNYLPPVHFDLPVSCSLKSACIAEIRSCMDSSNEPGHMETSESDPSSSYQTEHETVRDSYRITPMNCQFLGAVEIPPDCASSSQLNDVFSYILSCRSASDVTTITECSILVTKGDVWILSGNYSPSKSGTSTSKGEMTIDTIPCLNSNELDSINVLARIPFGSVKYWHIYPDNHQLGCFHVQGPLVETELFANSNCSVIFAFESNFSVLEYLAILYHVLSWSGYTELVLMLTDIGIRSNSEHWISEQLLAAQLERLDTLKDDTKDENERATLMSCIAKLSDNDFSNKSKTDETGTVAST